MKRGLGLGRAMLLGVIAGLIVAVLGGAAAFLFAERLVPAEEVDRFVLVVAGPGEDGAIGARIVAVVDISQQPLRIESMDPDTPAELAGTSVKRLSEVYAFRGGAGVAAEISEGDPFPHFTLSPEAAGELLEGLTVQVPADMEVFTGLQLISYHEGTERLSAEEAIWVLEGARYLPRMQERRLREAIARAAFEELASSAGGLSGVTQKSGVRTDISERELARLDTLF